MKRKRRKSKLTMDFMEFSRETTRFRRGAQYLRRRRGRGNINDGRPNACKKEEIHDGNTKENKWKKRTGKCAVGECEIIFFLPPTIYWIYIISRGII